MKFYVIKVSLLKKRKRINRTLQVPFSFTFAQLHQMIQIAFNGENVEYYEFETKSHLYKRLKDGRQILSTSKKIHFDEKEVFEYRYDLINPLYFKCEVIQIIQGSKKQACILEAHGDNLYETVTQIESQKQSCVDLEWKNLRLSAFSKDSRVNQQFHDAIQESIDQLVEIRYFQDVMHGRIVKIECPEKRFVYFGCDASKELYLNFHRNASKLVQYLQMNKKAYPVCLQRYQDCITLSLYKIPAQERNNYMFRTRMYGGFVTSYDVFENENIREDEKVLYAFALRQYVKVIEYCAKHQLKREEGKMECISLQGEMTSEPLIFEDEKVILGFESALKNHFSSCKRSEDMIEIDVMSVEDEDHQELCSTILMLARNQKVVEYILQNASLKTIMSEVFLNLEASFFQEGIVQKIRVRDKNMAQMLSTFTSELNIEVVIQTHLPQIDQHYYDRYYSKVLHEHEIPIQQVAHEIFHSIGLNQEILEEIVLPSNVSFEEGLEEIMRQLLRKKIHYKKLN